jgi:hypothetical protein
MVAVPGQVLVGIVNTWERAHGSSGPIFHPTSDDGGYGHCSSPTRADGVCPFAGASKVLPLWDGLRDLDANLDEIVTTLN